VTYKDKLDEEVTKCASEPAEDWKKCTNYPDSQADLGQIMESSGPVTDSFDLMRSKCKQD
jgi:hypothetical protein